MIEKNESKTLYDEIFNANKAPEVIDNNGNQEIKDALKMEKFDNKELIDLEDIFVFEDQEKNNDSSSNDNSLELPSKAKEDIALDDAKYYDLINNTLVDLRLNLEDNNDKVEELQSVNLDNLIKNDNENAKEEALQEDIKEDLNTEVLEENQGINNVNIEVSKEQPQKKGSYFWLNYAFVAILVVISIIGSLTLLIK